MSKTERFPVTVQTEHKSYAPGEPVPVGGERGISTDEVANLRANFGDWTGGPEVNAHFPTGLDAVELQSQIDTVTRERDELQGEKDRLIAENSRLSGEIDQRSKEPKSAKAELGKLRAENSRLSSDYQALQANSAQLETDNATLASHVEQLNGDIAKLTAPKT